MIGLVSTAPIGGASYAASKAGIIGLTRELAGQWGRRGIRVNAIVPGWFDTEMTDGLFTNEKSAGWVRRNTMLGRGGRAGRGRRRAAVPGLARVELRHRARARRRWRVDRPMMMQALRLTAWGREPELVERAGARSRGRGSCCCSSRPRGCATRTCT